ncbi:SLAM family member 9-like [Carlito syrichta]|uniref:SLAM family member 9-like n=1 Tax=Carlito syrichta TaxID=1868482 RepID=A0A3Q0E2W1_CARSF|nr:SLAM family member 9-like [Carlito syrichta]
MNPPELASSNNAVGPEASRENLDPLVVSGMLGRSVTLPLQLSGQQVESISWTSRSVPKAIATVNMVEARGPDNFYQAETRSWGRVSVVDPDCSLQISSLSWEDAGSYRAHVNLWNSLTTLAWEYLLQVYEQLARPHVALSSRVGENGHCLVILTCVAQSRGGAVTYSWTPLGPRTVVSHGGSVLSVSQRPGDSTLTFTCIVKNPVSNSSSHPVSMPHFCTGIATGTGMGIIGMTLTAHTYHPFSVELATELNHISDALEILQNQDDFLTAVVLQNQHGSNLFIAA